MPDVIVTGGGLAGLAAAAALSSAGFAVELFESRAVLGGRAGSFSLDASNPNSAWIDNCQHVLLRCCVNLLDLYRRLGVQDLIRFYREYYFIEPGGRVSVFPAGSSNKLRSVGALIGLHFLSAGDKLSVIRGLAALRAERRKRNDLDRITMLDWLQEKRQTAGAVNRFWKPVLVSAINEDLDRMAACHGFQVFSLAFLTSGGNQLGIPTVPLSRLYDLGDGKRLPGLKCHLRTPVERIVNDGNEVTGIVVKGETRRAGHYICSVPFEKLVPLAPELNTQSFEHSPIAGIHLWFDRPVMDLPHASLLDRTIHWAFNKDSGKYIQVVVSACRSLVEMSREDVITLVMRELGEFFPEVRVARLERALVLKEIRATFSARPGMEAIRPPAGTMFKNLYLAGDWTRSGWPATMEGAVRSGYLAAEAVAASAGRPQRFLIPDSE